MRWLTAGTFVVGQTNASILTIRIAGTDQFDELVNMAGVALLWLIPVAILIVLVMPIFGRPPRLSPMIRLLVAAILGTTSTGVTLTTLILLRNPYLAAAASFTPATCFAMLFVVTGEWNPITVARHVLGIASHPAPRRPTP
jgi:hypothetical protein